MRVADGAGQDQPQREPRSPAGSRGRARRRGRRRCRRPARSSSQGPWSPRPSSMPKLTPRFQTRTRLKNGVTGRRGWYSVRARSRTAHLVTWSSDQHGQRQQRPGHMHLRIRVLRPPARWRRHPCSAGTDARAKPSTSGRTCQQRWHFSPSAKAGHHRDARHIVEREGIRRGRAVGQLDAAGDRELGQVEPGQQLRGRPRPDSTVGRRLQAGADPLLLALELQRAGDDAADLADALPARAQRRVAPARPAGRGNSSQMHAAPRRG